MKRGLALFLSLCLVALAVAPASVHASDAELKKYQQEQQKLKDQLNQVNKKQKQNESQQKQVVRTINQLEGQIDTIETQIGKLEGGIRQTELDIKTKGAELAEAERSVVNRKDTLNARLRVMYKTGNVGYLEVLLGSRDFGDLLTRIDTVRKIYVHDTNMVRFLIDQKNIIAEKKQELEAYKTALANKVNEKEAAQANLNVKVGELESAKKKLVADHKVLEEQEDKLKAEADKVTKILSAMKPTQKYVGGSMVWPAPGYTKITSPFGTRIHPILKTKKLHTGIDVSVPSGSKIVAAQSGTVIHANWLGGYGKTIMVDHGGGIVTLYAHNSSLLVSEGTKVAQGQAIAKSGSTGLSTGPHLHFEVRVNGQYVEPLKYVSP